jgi:hypothetical protein
MVNYEYYETEGALPASGSPKNCLPLTCWECSEKALSHAGTKMSDAAHDFYLLAPLQIWWKLKRYL